MAVTAVVDAMWILAQASRQPSLCIVSAYCLLLRAWLMFGSLHWAVFHRHHIVVRWLLDPVKSF